MSTKAARLAAKRDAQAAFKRKRDQSNAERKQATQNDPTEAINELHRREKALDDAVREFRALKNNMFRERNLGWGSADMIQKMEAQKRKIRRLKNSVQAQNIMINPNYLKDRQAEKTRHEQENREKMGFWDNLIESDQLAENMRRRATQIIEESKGNRERHLESVRQEEDPEASEVPGGARIKQKCCYIMRKNGGIIVSMNEMGYVPFVTCYHSDSEGDASIGCDCTREEKRGVSLTFSLSPENQVRHQKGLLKVDDSQWEVQKLKAKQLFLDNQAAEYARKRNLPIPDSFNTTGTGAQVFGFLGPYIN